ALMKMDDDGEQDDKVIAVPSEDPRYDHVEDVDDLTDQQKAEIAEFFETYKNLEEGKHTEVLGWEDREATLDAIEHGQDLYEQEF
ncbi:MAG: inorganic diphosphatase, partial [Halobacteriaceae archaeon]